MQPGYPKDAFSFKQMHDDDIRSVKTMYPEISGIGALNKLSTVVKGTQYTAKSPYPTECHSHIDAALFIRDFVYIVSGPFIWRMRLELDGWHAFDNYPKRVADVFQQAYGALEALFKVENDKGQIAIFALHAGNKISQYFILLREGNTEPYIGIKWAGKERKSYLVSSGIAIDTNIKSAFTSNDKTILVEDGLENYFELTWKFNKLGVPKPAAIRKSSDMISLIGRKPHKVHFNAAISFTKNNKEKIYMFGARYVYVEEPFSNIDPEDKKSVWFEVPNHFKVAGWCPVQ